MASVSGSFAGLLPSWGFVSSGSRPSPPLSAVSFVSSSSEEVSTSEVSSAAPSLSVSLSLSCRLSLSVSAEGSVTGSAGSVSAGAGAGSLGVMPPPVPASGAFSPASVRPLSLAIRWLISFTLAEGV